MIHLHTLLGEGIERIRHRHNCPGFISAVCTTGCEAVSPCFLRLAVNNLRSWSALSLAIDVVGNRHCSHASVVGLSVAIIQRIILKLDRFDCFIDCESFCGVLDSLMKYRHAQQ
jgi:hypothetical protein